MTNTSAVITGSDISVFQLVTLRAGLKLEILGMKKRGKSSYSIIKSRFGYKGNKVSVLEQFEAHLAEVKAEARGNAPLAV